MSLIGGYRLAGVSSSSVYSTSIGNFIGFPISGHTDSNVLACCMFKWDAVNNQWTPYTGQI